MKDSHTYSQAALQPKSKKDLRDSRDPYSERKSVHYDIIPEDIPVMGPIEEEYETAAPQQDIPVLDLNNDETRKRRKTKGR